MQLPKPPSASQTAIEKRLQVTQPTKANGRPWVELRALNKCIRFLDLLRSYFEELLQHSKLVVSVGSGNGSVEKYLHFKSFRVPKRDNF